MNESVCYIGLTGFLTSDNVICKANNIGARITYAIRSLMLFGQERSSAVGSSA